MDARSLGGCGLVLGAFLNYEGISAFIKIGIQHFVSARPTKLKSGQFVIAKLKAIKSQPYGLEYHIGNQN
jgi:hypothetical protein